MRKDPGISATTVRRWGPDGETTAGDQLIVEQPLEIRLVHGRERTATSISVTMRTPGEDHELAVGFLLTEGIIRNASDVMGVEHCGPPDPETGQSNVVRVSLRPDLEVDLDRLKRNVYTTSSCGVCGKTSIDAVSVSTTEITSNLTLDAATLATLPDRLRALQPRFAASGAVHAAGLADNEGSILLIREDVGRHNAVDKVIGHASMTGAPEPHRCVLVLSGRAGFELVQKAAVAQIPIVIAVGAPSSLAVELALRLRLSLAGFVRSGSFVIYADGAGRIR